MRRYGFWLATALAIVGGIVAGFLLVVLLADHASANETARQLRDYHDTHPAPQSGDRTPMLVMIFGGIVLAVVAYTGIIRAIQQRP